MDTITRAEVSFPTPVNIVEFQFKFEAEWLNLFKAGRPSTLVLTPELLGSSLLPYLQTISDFQRILTNLGGKVSNDFISRFHQRRKVPKDMVIRSITCSSPISVTLGNAGDAIKEIRKTIIPWERKNRKTLSELRELELAADIALKQSQVNESRVRRKHEERRMQLTSAETQRLHAEAEKLKADAAKMRAEAEEIRVKVTSQKVALAMKIIDNYGRGLSPTEKMTYLTDLLSAIDTIVQSDLDFEETQNTKVIP